MSSEAEIYLISKAPRPASESTHCLVLLNSQVLCSK